MSGWKKGRRSDRKSVSFNPNRNYIKSAIDKYLKDGGKITKIEMDEEAYQAFIKMRDAAADDFLRGQQVHYTSEIMSSGLFELYAISVKKQSLAKTEGYLTTGQD